MRREEKRRKRDNGGGRRETTEDGIGNRTDTGGIREEGVVRWED